MKSLLNRGLALACALIISTPAYAGVPISDVPVQGQVMYVKLPDGTYAPLAGDAAANGSVVGSFSATLSGFNPTAAATANLTDVVNVSQDVALPAGADIVVTNKGSVTINFRLQAGAGTAVATDQALVAGAAAGFHITTATHISAIAPTGTATGATAGQLNVQGGTGLATGYGGGSSTSSALPPGASTSANQTSEITQVTSVNTNLTNITGTKAAGTAAANSILNGCVYNTSLPTLTNGQQAAAQCDSSGRPLVTVSGAGDASAANQTVVQGVIGAATAPTKMAVAGGVYNSSPITLTNGQSSAAQFDANGYQKVNVAAGNGAAQGAAIAGQTPSTIGCQTLTSGPSVYSTATTNPANCDEYGALITHPYALQDRLVKGTTAAMTGTTSTSLVGAPGVGLKNYITTLSCVNSHATVGTFVTVQDGSGGTAIWTVAAAALFGGTAITFPAPLPQPTANTALFVADVTTGANVICSASGYKAP